MSAIDDIAAERLRQIGAEGWTFDHDDAHFRGELTLAAMAYCHSAATLSARGRDDTSVLRGHPATYWPWDRRWWKPLTRRRDLVRAAALIVAEIERLDRAASKEPRLSGCAQGS